MTGKDELGQGRQPQSAAELERESDATGRKTRPQRKRKLGAQILESLLERIAAGHYPRGSLLPSERELMELFQVGRPSVREALQALEHMGFVTISHGDGARVMPLTAHGVLAQISRTVVMMLSGSDDMLNHFKDARLLFERSMVRLAAEQASDEDVGHLGRILDQHRRSMDDPEKFLETDMAFHRAIAEISHNPIYVAIADAILGWMRQFHVDAVQTRGGEQLTFDEHQKLFNQIAAGNAKGAEKTLDTHIRRASRKYRRNPSS